MRIIVLLAALFLWTNVSAQKMLNIKSGKFADKIGATIPYRNIEKTEDGYLVTYSFNDAIIQEDDLFEGTVFWKMDGFGLDYIPGDAEILFRNDLFVVPANTKPAVEVVDCSYVDYQYELTPARQPLVNSDEVGYNKENVKPIEPFEGFRPSSLASLSGTTSYRGQGLCYIKVYPIQYSYEKKTVRAYTSITYKVTFEESVEESSRTPYISITDNFLNNVAIGGETVSPALTTLPAETAVYDVKDYLIISTPEFEEAVNRFAYWKRMQGFNVHVDLRNNWTPDMVKNAVDSCYNIRESLYYLLIVGDHDDVPGEYVHDYDMFIRHYTDLYYGCLGEDVMPTIKRGRLSVSTLTEANIVIDKIINYERNPPIDYWFYNNGTHASYFQDNNHDGYADRRFAQTSEDIRDYLMNYQNIEVERIYTTNSPNPTHWNNGKFSYGEPIPNELRMPTFQWNGDNSDISTSINMGSFYLLHRDHGEVDYWGSPSYTIQDIDNLNNENLLPVVFSISCLTGKFDEDCFAESFLRKNNGGCVAIYAASESSWSGYNDVLACGMFDAIWPTPGLRISFQNVIPGNSPTPTPNYCLGDILDQGLTRVAETCTALDSVKGFDYTTNTRELFHLFGDPSMQIHTEQPTDFENADISYNMNSIDVSLAEGETARITFFNENTNDVASFLGNNVNFAATNPYDWTICISAHNKIPFIYKRKEFIYIQNETVSGLQNFEAGQIFVGSDVTSEKPNGNAVFSNGNIRMDANKVVLDKGTIVELGTKLVINNQ